MGFFFFLIFKKIIVIILFLNLKNVQSIPLQS
jgi:hypothetical protein